MNNQQTGSGMPAPKQSNNLFGGRFAHTLSEIAQAFEQSKVSSYKLDLEKELQAPDAVLTLGGCCVASRGNLSAVVGEAKCKKTFLASGFVASLLHLRKEARPFPMIPTDNYFMDRIIWVDTEQSEFHARRVADRITRMSGYPKREGGKGDPRIDYFTLREVDPKERFALLLEAIELIHPALVVVDGVADLQRNTNDLEESDRLVNLLMSLSTLHDCHILSILHTNPGSDKARGHLGSSLQRKSETVLYVHKVGEKSLVEPQFCRNEPFDRFAFRVNEEGIPELCDLPEEPSQPSGEVERILRDYYGGAVERTVLTDRVAELCSIDRHTATMRISRAIKRGDLECHEKIVSLPKPAPELTPEPAPAPTPVPTPVPVPAPIPVPDTEEETPF